MNKQLHFHRWSAKVLKTYIHIPIDATALICDIAYMSDTHTLYIYNHKYLLYDLSISLSTNSNSNIFSLFVILAIRIYRSTGINSNQSLTCSDDLS